MSKGPKFQPPTRADATPRIDLIAAIFNEIDGLDERYPELVSIKSDIRRIAEGILATLPDPIMSRVIVSVRCENPANEAIEDLSHIDSEPTDEKIRESLIKLRQDLCARTSLVLYNGYIQQVVGEIRAYQESHKPKRWGIGSIIGFVKRDKNSQLSKFKSFWKNNVEAEGDTFFRAEVIPKLPLDWQATYEPKLQSKFQWAKMTHEEIALALSSLKPKRNPAKKRWSLAGIISWTGENGEKDGSSFYHFWEYHFKNDDEKFRTLILPHLPIDWQPNFVTNGTKGLNNQGSYDWEIISNEKLVETLVSLIKRRKDPAVTRWSFGSVVRLKEEDGEQCGTSFYNFWKGKYKDKAHQEFEKQLLPLFPPAWQKTYRKRRYEISFTSTPPEFQKKIEKENNLEELVSLAHKGYLDAFNKALAMTIHYISNRFPNSAVPYQFVERIIHNHLPALRKFETYLSISVSFYVKYEMNRKTRSMDEFPDLHDRGFGVTNKDQAEDAFLNDLESQQRNYDSIIELLQDLDLPSEQIDLLAAQIQSGKTLDQLMNDVNPEMAEVARKVSSVLFIN